jgi:hypothetical protein
MSEMNTCVGSFILRPYDIRYPLNRRIVGFRTKLEFVLESKILPTPRIEFLSSIP